MLKCFPIDFIRQILEQKLEQEHMNNVNFYGGKNQVSLLSFYEQLKSQEEVNRFVETYRDLSEQENRMGLILNGVLVSPENPTITNLYSSLIVPMSYSCSFRCNVMNRDDCIITLNNLIEKLKGRKVDVAQLNCVDEDGKPYSTPFCVGTIGQNSGQPALNDSDYIGEIESKKELKDYFDDLLSKGVDIDLDKEYLLYGKYNNKLNVVKVIYNGEQQASVINYSFDQMSDFLDRIKITYEISIEKTYSTIQDINVNATLTLSSAFSQETYENVHGTVKSSTSHGTYVTYVVEFVVAKPDLFSPSDCDISDLVVYEYGLQYQILVDDGSIKDIIFPPTNNSFEKYKVSLSFDAIRCDEPRNLNGDEYCQLSFGGSATLVSDGVQFGNDLLKILIAKIGIQAETYIDFVDSGEYPSWYLEPLEMPSGNNANTQINQLVSRNFITNSHTDAIALTLQYSFIYDKEIKLLKQWFDYARYGKQGITKNDISPNMDYGLVEYWSSWGEFETYEIITKIVENIDIENTESDVLTLSVSMQVQGEWE